MKRKKVLFDPSCYKRFEKLPKEVKSKFNARIRDLGYYGKLEQPFGKKLNNNLYEIRVKEGRLWRMLYAYMINNEIILLSVFQKTTQKTPLRELKTAQKRLKKYYVQPNKTK